MVIEEAVYILVHHGANWTLWMLLFMAACQNVVSLGKVHPEKLLFYMMWGKGDRAQSEFNTPSSPILRARVHWLCKKRNHTLCLLICKTEAHDASRTQIQFLAIRTMVSLDVTKL